jgi:hypothetical protein
MRLWACNCALLLAACSAGAKLETTSIPMPAWASEGSAEDGCPDLSGTYQLFGKSIEADDDSRVARSYHDQSFRASIPGSYRPAEEAEVVGHLRSRDDVESRIAVVRQRDGRVTADLPNLIRMVVERVDMTQLVGPDRCISGRIVVPPLHVEGSSEGASARLTRAVYLWRTKDGALIVHERTEVGGGGMFGFGKARVFEVWTRFEPAESPDGS